MNNINIEGTNFHNVQDAYRMFFNCHRIKNIPNNINLKNATNIGDMFYGCHNIGTIPNIFGNNISGASQISNVIEFGNCNFFNKVFS